MRSLGQQISVNWKVTAKLKNTSGQDVSFLTAHYFSGLISQGSPVFIPIFNTGPNLSNEQKTLSLLELLVVRIDFFNQTVITESTPSCPITYICVVTLWDDD